MISAKIIADSINTQGQRLTTFVLVFPRIVLAEFNTHRMISRNSASSRAIPFDKMLEMVTTNPFIPIKWMKEHTGMQGTQYFEDPRDIHALVKNHLRGRDWAVETAKGQDSKGLTKQIVNRYLEPFMWHTVIATGTDWENFFSLRAHEAAEIHIQDLAYKMLEVYNKSVPNLLQPGDWHIPFGDQIDIVRLGNLPFVRFTPDGPPGKVLIATARCARISYNTFEGKDDYEADIKLHDRLASSGHWSPFEHCARAMNLEEFSCYLGNTVHTKESETRDRYSRERGWCGNFRGFIQYRKLFNNENRTDTRVINKSEVTVNS